LTGRPQWKSGLNVSWAISQDLNAGLNAQWVDTTLGTSLYTGSTEVTELDDYLRVDANVRWQINPAIKLTLALDNLFDEDYQEAVGFPSPGRALRFSTVLQF
jgi:outer membrane cobalamin receptor